MSTVHVAQKMRLAIKQLKLPSANQKVSQYVTISLGVTSVVPSQKTSPRQLLDEADKALYQAKKQGRDRVVLAKRPTLTTLQNQVCVN